MKAVTALMLALTWINASKADAQAVSAYAAVGAHAVGDKSITLHDEKRNRDVPVKVYFPADAKEGCPVIVFSHGLGGSREGYAYLGRHWASHGYVVVHLQHVGSDTEVIRNAKDLQRDLKRAAFSPENIINRPLDVTFAIDQLTKLNKEDGDLKGKMDLDHIGMAGHSFGAYTTLAIAGEVFVTPGGDKSVADERVKAAIAMSPQAPSRAEGEQLDRVFGSITIPVFHMTGTLDDSPIGETKAAERRVPFDRTSHGDAYLMILDGGDHMVFSGRARRGGPLDRTKADASKDETFHSLILQSSTAFWDATLKGDAAAKKWLDDGAFKEVLGDRGSFEVKKGEKG